MNSILVTGANGYLGRHVVSELLDLGYDVIAADIKLDNVDIRATGVACDIFSDKDGLYSDLGSPKRIIHLAWKDGFVHNSPSHLEMLPKHLSFIEKMIDGGCESISVMGSMHEVGYYEGAIDENTPTNPISFYGISKNALRQALTVLGMQKDFSFKWLRGFYITGDDSKNNSIFAKLLKKAQDGEKEFPFTTGTNKYDFIDIKHLALQIALASVQDEVSGIINCCSGKPVALKDKVEEFIRINNLDIKLNYGFFPERPYDSKIIYGDNSKILSVLNNALNYYDSAVNDKIVYQIQSLCK